MGEVRTGQWLGKSSRGIIARLESWSPKVDCHGERFWACDFIAPEGICHGRVWPDDVSTSTPEALQVGCWYLVVSVSGQWGTASLNKLAAIVPVAQAFDWLGMPAGGEGARCDDWNGVSWWLGRIPDPVVQAFVLRVFLNESLRESFFSVPASRHHHHFWRGGLVEHSLEVAEQVASNRLIRDPLDRWLGSVAGLFHDVGKIRTLNTRPSLRRCSEILDHDRLTLEVLSPSLAWLDWVDPDIGQMLRYFLIWDPAREPRPLIPAVMAMREADRMSAGMSASEITFATAPAWARFAKLNASGPKNRFWRSRPGRRVISPRH